MPAPRIRLYLDPMDAAERAQPGGGLVEKGKDTKVVVQPFQEGMETAERGEIQDAKTVLCLQYLALHRDAQ